MKDYREEIKQECEVCDRSDNPVYCLNCLEIKLIEARQEIERLKEKLKPPAVHDVKEFYKDE